MQRAIVRFLAALPRKPPAGKTAADHAALLCLSANAALQLQIAGMPDRPIAGSAAVVALLLRADVTVAVADVLTAAAERCTAALDENTALAASGPLQELRAQEVWRDAAQAWHLSHVGACERGRRGVLNCCKSVGMACTLSVLVRCAALGASCWPARAVAFAYRHL